MEGGGGQWTVEGEFLTEGNEVRRWRMKRGRITIKVVAACLAVLATGLTILYLLLPGIILHQLNNILAKQLTSKAAVTHVELHLLKGYAAINNLSIQQPAGFGTNQLFRSEHASLKISLSSLMGNCTVIEHVMLENAEFNIVKNKQGKLNLGTAVKPTVPAAEPTTDDTTKLIDLRIDKITMNSCHFRYIDQSIAESGFTFAVTNISATLNQLRLAPQPIDTISNVANLELTALISQANLRSAPIAIFASIGPVVGTNIPSVNSAIRVIGLELKPLGITFPSLKEILGGNALDLVVNTRMTGKMLDCQIEANMDSGQKHKLSITGTPRRPLYDKNQNLGLVIGRTTGLFGNTAGHLASSGMNAANTVMKTTVGVVKGTEKTITNLGKGLYDTAKSVATLDLMGTASNLTQTTTGAIGDAIKTVTKSSTTLLSGAEQTVKTAAGVTGNQQFRDQIEQRKERMFAAAQSWISNQPLPSE